MAQLVEGVWTPNAEVLCLPCHGPRFYERVMPAADMEQRSKPVDALPEGCGETSCDQCKRRIFVSEKVAGEHEIVLELRKKLGEDAARMDQTGGMCSAARVALSGGRYLLLVDDEAEQPGYLIGLYESNEDYEGKTLDEEGKPTPRWVALPREKAIELAAKLAREAA